ncbi:hypothetical protein KGM_207229 [Danaus plexippus plexippus]|uniref:Uncharacterized protein n=1 Tax=Danaus plexippus plexippus TaxID=278856 RepID=A0A212FJX4_DANPL|nr:hypothetical protein KGM_207229 [Danaus plexippus plexippus]
MYRGTLNITFLDQTKIEEIKMSVYTMKDNVKTLLWNYIVSKPCQHYSLATLIDTSLKVKNCVVKKGEYYLDLNLTELMMNYIGNSFFYGDYIFKVVVTSKKGNIVCLIFDPKFKKKSKNV